MDRREESVNYVAKSDLEKIKLFTIAFNATGFVTLIILLGAMI